MLRAVPSSKSSELSTHTSNACKIQNTSTPSQLLSAQTDKTTHCGAWAAECAGHRMPNRWHMDGPPLRGHRRSRQSQRTWRADTGSGMTKTSCCVGQATTHPYGRRGHPWGWHIGRAWVSEATPPTHRHIRVTPAGARTNPKHV